MEEVNVPEAMPLNVGFYGDMHFIILVIAVLIVVAVGLRFLHRNATREFVYDPRM